MVSYHNITWLHNPEYTELNVHRRENFKSRKILYVHLLYTFPMRSTYPTLLTLLDFTILNNHH